MSILTDSLERILYWFQQNQPSFASFLEPGLGEQDIRNIVEHEFPLLLPTEFYELYQWRNGTVYGEDFAFFFPGCIFHSLEYALDLYNDLLEKATQFALTNNLASTRIWNQGWLPIFTIDNEEYLCIIGSEEVSSTSPILSVFGGTAVRYVSLTGMMQAVAECYETDAYYISEWGNLEVDEAMAEQIRLEYNEGADLWGV